MHIALAAILFAVAFSLTTTSLLQSSDASLPPALLLVGLGILIGSVLNRRLSPLTMVAGAIAATSVFALGASVEVLAGALALLALYTPRVLRTRSSASGVLVAALSVASGGLAAALVARFEHAGLDARIASIGVSSLLVLTPMLVTVDDKTSVALRSLAKRTPSPVKQHLLRALAIRRRMLDTSELPKPIRKKVGSAWKEVVALGEACAERGVASSVLRERLALLTRSLTDLCRAAESRGALTFALSSIAHEDMSAESAGLEAEANALREIV